MTFSTRLDQGQLEASWIDDELPVYEPATSPEYDITDREIPSHIFVLRQYDRRTQIYVDAGNGPAYLVSSTGSIRLLFSKKADMEIFRMSLDRCSIGSISFVNEGPFPWRPRAKFSYSNTSHPSAYLMESPNFSDWTLNIDGADFVWRLKAGPVALVLTREQSEGRVVARFTYSSSGVLAERGAPIGELTVFQDALSMDREGVEKIIVSSLVSIAHFRRMGRHYRNGNATSSRTGSWASAANSNLQIGFMGSVAERRESI